MSENNNEIIYTGSQHVDTSTGEIIDVDELVAARQEYVLEQFKDARSLADALGVGLEYKLVRVKKNDYPCVNIKQKFEYNKIFRVELMSLLSEIKLSAYALAFLGRFTPCLVFPENYIQLDGKFPTLEELGRELDIEKRKMQYVLNELAQFEIIEKVKSGKQNIIYINPFLYSTGWITIDTYKRFKNSIYNPQNK